MRQRSTEHYSTVKAMRSGGLRAPLRHLVLDGLSLMERMRGMEKDLRRPRVQFLYVHHTFKDEEDRLERLMHELARHHTFIPYGEAVKRVFGNRIDKPYIAFSSDDGFRNNLAFAHILEQHGASACFFINPALIGETDHAKITQHCAARLHFPPVEFLDWDDVADLQRRGHEIGSHTMEHMNVADASPEQITADMQATYEILSQRCGAVEHFAFPYGRTSNFNEFAQKACFDAGFTSCASAERGCHVNMPVPPDPRNTYILRDHVILDWEIRHVLYFLVRNSRRPERAHVS